MNRQILAAELWWERNKGKLRTSDDLVLGLIGRNEIAYDKVLEIGCANGWRLAELQKHKPEAEYFGCDLSREALQAGANEFPDIIFHHCSAARLVFEREQFDLVIYGFCLSMCLRKELFQIVAEGDRVLKEQGYLIVYDYSAKWPNTDASFVNLWCANPCYHVVDWVRDYERQYTAWLVRKDFGVWRDHNRELTAPPGAS